MVRVPDESQRRAIFASPERSVLVTAPPGYGKTYVMPKRIAFLIKNGSLTPPERALGLTFTNAAASEMLSRMEEYVGSKYLGFVDAMTFHSFCYQVLRANGNVIGLSPNFAILPEGIKQELYEGFVRKHALSTDTHHWRNYRDWENHRTVRLEEDPDPAHPFSRFWKAYQQYQKTKARVDFNHLLWFAYELFRNHPEVLSIYRNAYKYILVDEYQDTNPLQFALLDLLIRGNANGKARRNRRPVFIFGDDWQSIYGFLGAVPDVQLAKAKRLFGCSVVELTEDHRVSSPALSLFGKTMRSGASDSPKTPESSMPLFVLQTPTAMATQVDTQVTEWTDLGVPLHDIAILSRHRWQLAAIHDALHFDYIDMPDLQAKGLENNPVFKALVQSAERATPVTSLRRFLDNSTQEEDVSRGERYIRQILLDLAGNYDLRFSHLGMSERARLMMNEALLEINWGQQLRQYCRDRIFTGTLHSAKGLEFKAVAIVHLDQNSFPYRRFICQYCVNEESVEDSLQEEWRVFYVGVTRASEHLALFSSALDWRGRPTPISCLVEPRIQSHLQVIDCRQGSVAKLPMNCCYRDSKNIHFTSSSFRSCHSNAPEVND